MSYLPEFQTSDNQIINIFENKEENENDNNEQQQQQLVVDNNLNNDAVVNQVVHQDKRPKTSDNVNFNPRRVDRADVPPYDQSQKKNGTSKSPSNERTTQAADQQSMAQMGKSS